MNPVRDNPNGFTNKNNKLKDMHITCHRPVVVTVMQYL